MVSIKRRRYYPVMVYAFIVLCIGSFLLLHTIKFLNAGQTDTECPIWTCPESIYSKPPTPCPKPALPPCTREAGK